ncbi:hypothetical protein ACLOJK_033442 [Asimina triloba]
MEVDNQLLLCISQEASFEIRPEVVGPPQPAALAAAKEAGELGNSSPAALAIGEDEVDELLVFLGGPWPLLHAQLVTAGLSAHH